MEPLKVSQQDKPCVLHKVHSPLSVVNEMHHPFPQEWQKDLWGQVKDNRMVSLCATGHNNVHAAIEYYKKNNKFPEWCVGATRDLAETAFARLAEAQKNEPARVVEVLDNAGFLE